MAVSKHVKLVEYLMWFEPAELRVLASRYLTDIAEIQHRLGGKPADPAVYNELERRR
jgi:hypothetical protein